QILETYPKHEKSFFWLWSIGVGGGLAATLPLLTLQVWMWYLRASRPSRVCIAAFLGVSYFAISGALWFMVLVAYPAHFEAMGKTLELMPVPWAFLDGQLLLLAAVSAAAQLAVVATFLVWERLFERPLQR